MTHYTLPTEPGWRNLVNAMVSNTIVRKDLRVRIPLPALSESCAARHYARRMRLERALAEIGERLTKAQEELRIAEEQLVYQADVADEAKTRALVAETPLADREYQEAKADHERMVRIRDAARREVADLKAEQDKILDRMLG